MPDDYPAVAFIGVGTMSEAIIAPALQDGWPRDKLLLTHRRADRREELRALFGGEILADNVAAVEGSDVVVLSVRPQQVEDMLSELRPALGPGKLLCSIAAALDLPWYRRRVPEGMPVVRATPPPTTWISRGITLLSTDDATSAEQRAAVERLFGPVCDRVLWIEDGQTDVATAMGLAITPYTCLVLEAIVEAATAEGAAEDTVKEILHESLHATAEMIRDADLDYREIIGSLATREGLTWASLHTMEARWVPEGVKAGARAMIGRSYELRGEPVPAHLTGFER